MRWRVRISTRRDAAGGAGAPEDVAEGGRADGRLSRDTLRRIGFGVVFLAGCLVAVFSDGGYADYRRLRARVETQERSLERRRGEIAALESRVEALHGDRTARERIARERLGWVRDGEVVFLLPEAGLDADAR